MRSLPPPPPTEGAIALSIYGACWWKKPLACFALLAALWMLVGCGANTVVAQPFDRQDTLRGSNGRGRDWWDVQRYDLTVGLHPQRQEIVGWVTIEYRITGRPNDSMQIDLQSPMMLDNVEIKNQLVADVVKDGNVWWLKYPFSSLDPTIPHYLTIRFYGKPHQAVHPPWDGGFIWTTDSVGSLWAAVACQGFGASSWWPCKDYQGDEPDSGMMIDVYPTFANQDQMCIENNGLGRDDIEDTTLVWDESAGDSIKVISSKSYPGVKNPINTYNVTFYLGDYAQWTDTLQGLKGALPLTFNPLRYHEPQARKHFAVAKDMLRCYEYWLGPYPFYEDGYKLVEAPYLGMEHQSAVAYGNQYKMGYLGMDRSGTGIGKRFDYIIIHESGHEWFGNSITAQDMADNWIHEGFTTYCEVLFAECAYGRDKAFDYMRGLWRNIENDRPVIGNYGVNDAGGGDKYEKGAAVVHMVRAMIGDDKKFRQMLRGLNRDFYHSIVTTDQVERFMEKAVGRDLRPFFDQYLRTTQIPVLEMDWQGRSKQKVLRFRVTNAVPGFVLPVSFSTKKMAYADSKWQEVDAQDVRELWREDLKDWLVAVKKVSSEE